MVVITPAISARIWFLHTEGISADAIGRKLDLHRATVGYELRRLKEINGDFTAKRLYHGRKLIMSPSKVLRAKRSINSGEARNATACQRLHFPTIDPRRVREALSRIGLKGRVRKKRPMLTRRHVVRRKLWL